MNNYILTNEEFKIHREINNKISMLVESYFDNFISLNDSYFFIDWKLSEVNENEIIIRYSHTERTGIKLVSENVLFENLNKISNKKKY